jgi:hypothetical protein
MIRIAFGVLIIVIICALVGIDELTCGHGETIRYNIKSWIHGK